MILSVFMAYILSLIEVVFRPRQPGYSTVLHKRPKWFCCCPISGDRYSSELWSSFLGYLTDYKMLAYFVLHKSNPTIKVWFIHYICFIIFSRLVLMAVMNAWFLLCFVRMNLLRQSVESHARVLYLGIGSPLMFRYRTTAAGILTLSH